MTIQANILSARKAREAVKIHPMCLRLLETRRHFEVHFPAGDWPYDGIRVSRANGDTAALSTLLERMERAWMESYPCAAV